MFLVINPLWQKRPLTEPNIRLSTKIAWKMIPLSHTQTIKMTKLILSPKTSFIEGKSFNRPSKNLFYPQFSHRSIELVFLTKWRNLQKQTLGSSTIVLCWLHGTLKNWKILDHAAQFSVKTCVRLRLKTISKESSCLGSWLVAWTRLISAGPLCNKQW